MMAMMKHARSADGLWPDIWYSLPGTVASRWDNLCFKHGTEKMTGIVQRRARKVLASRVIADMPQVERVAYV